MGPEHWLPRRGCRTLWPVLTMKDKIVLITGATAGIGKQTALELAQMGAHVVIVGRNREKTEATAAELRKASANERVDCLIADLSSMAEVRRVAQEFMAQYPRLDVLINNAGAINMTREVTADGFERTFATNHLAYQLLATSLHGALKNAPAARVINVSSAAHRTGKLRFDDLMAERGYNAWLQYGRSKLANIYFTRELARRYEPDGITVNCLHPGFVASEFLSKGGVWKLLKPIAYLFAVDVAGGARTSVYLASSPEVARVSGQYFHKCKARRPWRWAEDDEAAARLWEASEKLLAQA